MLFLSKTLILPSHQVLFECLYIRCFVSHLLQHNNMLKGEVWLKYYHLVQRGLSFISCFLLCLTAVFIWSDDCFFFYLNPLFDALPVKEAIEVALIALYWWTVGWFSFCRGGSWSLRYSWYWGRLGFYGLYSQGSARIQIGTQWRQGRVSRRCLKDHGPWGRELCYLSPRQMHIYMSTWLRPPLVRRATVSSSWR